MEQDYQQSRSFAYSRSRRPGRGDAGAPPGRRGRRRAGRAGAAIDLAQRGIQVVLLLDDDNKLSTGSRAICFAKRTLEIFDRLGCGERMVDKGVSWNVGKVFFQRRAGLPLRPAARAGPRAPGLHQPAAVLRRRLPRRARRRAAADRAALEEQGRRRRRSTTIDVELTVETPGRPLHARRRLCGRLRRRAPRGAQHAGAGEQGPRLPRPLPDRRREDEGATSRPSAGSGSIRRSTATSRVLLHRQPDDVWRIDFQLGWDADPDEEKKPERVIPRVQALLGDGRTPSSTLEWVSVYTFACLRMDTFRHGRVIFAGDCGARRVAVRRARRQQRRAGCRQPGLEARSSCCDGQGARRAARQLRRTSASTRPTRTSCNSTRATDFITPKSEISRLFRDAVLQLAQRARRSRAGWSTAAGCRCRRCCADSPLNTPDADEIRRRHGAGRARHAMRRFGFTATTAGS